MIDVFCNLEDLEDGHSPMCDMTFEIADRTYDPGSDAWTLVFRASHDQKVIVGFSAVVPMTGWDERVNLSVGDDEFRSYWGPLTLRSTGAESDRLVSLMADYYGVQQIKPPSRFSTLSKLISRGAGSAWKMAPQIDCLAVGINSDPSELANEVVSTKLFFDQNIENGRYAEVFLTIDLPEGLAALNEKDEDYRGDLIAWLSRHGATVANPYLDQSGNQW